MRSTEQPDCAQVRRYLQQAARAREIAPPPEWLVAHAAACAACRGAVVLLAAELAVPPPEPFPVDCAACQEGLAAYIDRELAEGSLAALQADPTVGWHLWICSDCAEIYHMTRALAQATHAGVLALPQPLPPAPRKPGRLLHSLRLSRTFLAYALPRPMPALGAVRGKTPGGTVLLAEEDAGHRINLSVEQQPDANWQVVVTVVPPIEGWLALTLGERIFRARFDESGHAIVCDVPDALLNAADGPELVVGIELDES